MREDRRALAIAFVSAWLAVPAAADAPEPEGTACCSPRVDSYRNYTRQSLAGCARLVRLRPRETMSAEDVAQVQGCVAAGTRESRNRLEEALRALRRKTAREALRAYQSAFENALAGVAPTPEEPVAVYEQRQSSLRHALAHAWTRYELEEQR